MGDPIQCAILEALNESGGTELIDVTVFEQVLSDLGFMVVPIEDPTNLRYGADE